MNLLELFTSPKVVEEPEIGDDGDFCIVRANEKNRGLCGSFLDPNEAVLPDSEVPDSMTCPECLAIDAMVNGGRK